MTGGGRPGAVGRNCAARESGCSNSPRASDLASTSAGSGKSARSGRAARSERPARSDGPARSERPARSDRRARPARPTSPARPARPDGSVRPDWAVRSDRGSATVWSVGVIAVLCVVFGVVLAMGQVVLVRHRAAGAADLAALAAADHWMDGATAACAEADRVARAQHARLVRCAIGGEISDVTAASGREPFAAEVRSRAGPAGPVRPAGPAEPTGPAQPVEPAGPEPEARSGSGPGSAPVPPGPPQDRPDDVGAPTG
ncbi:Rv3654c family TadE-like protein [Streptomyces sp. NPDC058256]|uniref:Rv3654c family TadE-like protein n=1 Tax=Streptomyces sp. NPDC058256 TaxID=3346408 RepID=UPI0036EB674C